MLSSTGNYGSAAPAPNVLSGGQPQGYAVQPQGYAQPGVAAYPNVTSSGAAISSPGQVLNVSQSHRAMDRPVRPDNIDPNATYLRSETDPQTGAIHDLYTIKRQVMQPTQHMETVMQEKLETVHTVVPEVQTTQVPVVRQVPQQVTQTVMEPKQVTSTVMEPRQVTQTVMEPKQVTETIMVPQQVTKTIMQPRQVTSTVMEPRQVTQMVQEPKQVTSTVMQQVQEMVAQQVTVNKTVAQQVKTQVPVGRVVHGHSVHEHDEIIVHERPRVLQQITEQVVGGGVRGALQANVRHVGNVASHAEYMPQQPNYGGYPQQPVGYPQQPVGYPQQPVAAYPQQPTYAQPQYGAPGLTSAAPGAYRPPQSFAPPTSYAPPYGVPSVASSAPRI